VGFRFFSGAPPFHSWVFFGYFLIPPCQDVLWLVKTPQLIAFQDSGASLNRKHLLIPTWPQTSQDCPIFPGGSASGFYLFFVPFFRFAPPFFTPFPRSLGSTPFFLKRFSAFQEGLAENFPPTGRSQNGCFGTPLLHFFFFFHPFCPPNLFHVVFLFNFLRFLL